MDRSKISMEGKNKEKQQQNRKANMINLDCDGFICALQEKISFFILKISLST